MQNVRRGVSDCCYHLCGLPSEIFPRLCHLTRNDDRACRGLPEYIFQRQGGGVGARRTREHVFPSLTVAVNGSFEKKPQESKYNPGTDAVTVVPPGFHWTAHSVHRNRRQGSTVLADPQSDASRPIESGTPAERIVVGLTYLSCVLYRAGCRSKDRSISYPCTITSASLKYLFV